MKTGFIVFTVRGTEVSVVEYAVSAEIKQERRSKQACLHAPGAASSRPRTLEGPTIRFGVFFYESLIGLSFVGCAVVGPGAAVAVIDAVNRQFLKPSRTQTKCFPR